LFEDGVFYNDQDMKYAAVIEYDVNDPKVPEVRPAHRKYLAELMERGKLSISGPFPDGGALIVYNTASQEEAEKMLLEDPFTVKGVFKKWTLHKWKPIFISKDLPADVATLAAS